jgi:hypothetical protein
MATEISLLSSIVWPNLMAIESILVTIFNLETGFKATKINFDHHPKL